MSQPELREMWCRLVSLPLCICAIAGMFYSCVYLSLCPTTPECAYGLRLLMGCTVLYVITVPFATCWVRDQEREWAARAEREARIIALLESKV